MERKRLNGRFVKSGKNKECATCGITFYVVASRIKTKRFCSAFCQYRAGRDNPKGKKAHNWRGGKRTFADGYVRIYMPQHPLVGASKYIFEHRLVMEKHLGRYLKSTEIIHHINRVKNDNRIKNLELTTRGKHIKQHLHS